MSLKVILWFSISDSATVQHKYSAKHSVSAWLTAGNTEQYAVSPVGKFKQGYSKQFSV
jgi:hypothetical protein